MSDIDIDALENGLADVSIDDDVAGGQAPAVPGPPPFEQIPDEAYEGEPQKDGPEVTLEDFYAYMPDHKYIFRPTRELWGAVSVNARLPPVRVSAEKKISASAWLDQNRHVEQMTWSPAHPELIEGQLIDNGGWLEREGLRVFNLYRPPTPMAGDPTKAGPWLEHLQLIYPDEAEHIKRWLAQRVQRPGEKINHALVLGGAVGIGKDTLLQAPVRAVGTWNCQEVSPAQLMGRFNSYQKSVILRVSEARDQGEAGGARIDRYVLHERCKTLIAAPPDVLRCDEKNLREHSIPNLTGVVFTTNHRDGLYVTPDDRRYFVAWSELAKEDFKPTYWIDINHWYEHEGGYGHVAAYLASLDLSDFDPKAPPPKTAAFHAMADAGRAPEDLELADVLDALGNPAAVTIGALCTYGTDGFREWLTDRRNSRQIPHRMEAIGYIAVRNDAAKDGQWVVGGKRQTVYAKRELSIRDRIITASRLCREGRS